MKRTFIKCRECASLCEVMKQGGRLTAHCEKCRAPIRLEDDLPAADNTLLPVLLLGGGALFLVLLCSGLVGGVLLGLMNRPAAEVAQIAPDPAEPPATASFPASDPSEAIPVSVPSHAVPAPADQAGAAPATSSIEETAAAASLPERTDDPLPAEEPAVALPEPPSPAVAVEGVEGWQVQPDPPADMLSEPKNPALRITIPERNYAAGHVNWGTSDSRICYVSDSEKRQFLVWDLQEGVQLGKFFPPPDLPPVTKATVSRRGKYLATYHSDRSDDDQINVWRVADSSQTLSIPVPKGVGLGFLEFAGEERLLFFTNEERAFQVWNLSQSKQEHLLKPESPLYSPIAATSPGGSYLAYFNEEAVRVVDLRSGVLAGSCPGTSRNSKLITFAPDGTEVATLDTDRNLVVFSMSEGTASPPVSLQSAEEGARLSGSTYDGPFVQWLPDKSGWLVLGGAFIDRESGKIALKFPLPPHPTYRRGSRRVYDANYLLVQGMEEDIVGITFEKTPHDQIAAGKTIALSGGLPEDIGLPPLTLAKLDQVEERSLSDEPQGPFTPDPAPTPSAPPAEKLRVEGPSHHIQWVVDQPQTGTTTVLFGGYGADRLQVFDMATTRLRAEFAPPFESKAWAVSPDGASCLWEGKNRKSRLDVWSLPEGKHIASWRPYAHRKGSYQEVQAAWLIASDFALTINGEGLVIGWKLPECAAVYQIKISSGRENLLSPGGKYLLAPQGREITVFETRTGKVSARPEKNERGGAISNVVFHPDGDRVAMLASSLTDEYAVVWRLSTGKIEHSVRVPDRDQAVSSLAWCDDDYLLKGTHGIGSPGCNFHLIDLHKEQIEWLYQAATYRKVGGSCFDGHLRFISEKPPGAPKKPGNESTVLWRPSLPGPEVAALLAKRAPVTPQEPLFQSGSALKVDVELSKPLVIEDSDNEKLKESVQAAVTRSLTLSEYLVEDDAGWSLVLRTKETLLPHKLRIRTQAFGPTIEVRVTRLTVEVSLLSPEGKTVWSKTTTGETSITRSTRPPAKVDLEQYLHQRQWAVVLGQATLIGLPPEIFPSGHADGAGRSSLQDGEVLFREAFTE
ncbi:WD40 repeat domain-containing protein [Lignipirellula cremea]|uniref:WD domain, G-beta repeat n=1 Tax=Lignipirellula cremea TaxID=2528010 RepID=A0A518E0L4_9BACT|nr:WD40 repeat domain-containing protein [Lignipirellula cremea]QDU97634.1 hypothetical protein Pla8534_54840 [Lignipirellula cremea]